MDGLGMLLHIVPQTPLLTSQPVLLRDLRKHIGLYGWDFYPIL